MDSKMVDFSSAGSTLVCSLACEIDHHTARHLRESIDSELFVCRPELLILDFSCVRFMDSSGIALILGRVETAEAVGASVCLRGLCPTLMKLVKLSGLDRVRRLTISKGEC